MSVVPYRVAKEMAIRRLRAIISRLPPEERDKPSVVIAGRPLSYLDLLREVENDTPVGRQYVYMVARQLGYAVA